MLTPAEVASLWLAARPALPNYPKSVIALNPTYYYQLNETSTEAGVIDTMGNAPAPGTYNGDYVNGPAMVGGPGATTVFGGTAVPGLGGAATISRITATTPATSFWAITHCMGRTPSRSLCS